MKSEHDTDSIGCACGPRIEMFRNGAILVIHRKTMPARPRKPTFVRKRS